MKYKYSLVASTLVLATSMLSTACSSGGSDGAANPVSGVVSSATTSVGGVTGSGSSSGSSSSSGAFTASMTSSPTVDGIATLIVDANADGILDKSDTTYSTQVLDGSFSFKDVVVDETKPTKAQLTVEKDGFAPVVQTLTLTKDNPISLLTKIDTKPIFTEVIKLPATAADRANAFLKFGITKSSTGISTFSRMLSLSQLKAEADFGLGEDTLSESTIPASAFGANVTSVTAKMQAFDSTSAEDIALFPGAFSGHGKSKLGTTTTDETTENTLESAAFDMIKLTDQNGKEIELQQAKSSKLSGFDAASCSGMFWTRRVNTAQAAIIEAWGDDDTSKVGFQVPIWSNDNSTSSWEYVGSGDWNASQKSFSACVDKKWQGYLNCDSEIGIGNAPKQVCITAVDQFDKAISGFSVQARKGNSYDNAYIGSYGSNKGKGTLSLATGTPADWEFTYNGSITGWDSVGIDTTTTTVPASTVAGCDYDLNIVVDNPYSAEVYVFAVDDKNVTLANVQVRLNSNDYRNYLSKSAYTNAKGYAIFKVKPDVAYTASYLAGSKTVNVNGSLGADESADSGRNASVYVGDVNIAPTSYIHSSRSNITDKAETFSFNVSATDANNDDLVLVSLKLNGTTLIVDSDYTVDSSSIYSGSYYIRATLDLNSSAVSGITPTSLSTGNYTLTATFSDGKLTSTSNTVFNVAGNHAPTIGSVYLRDSNYGYFYENNTISAGDYFISAYLYDIDGDSLTKTVTVDTSVVQSDTAVTLAQGDHNITVSASDGDLTTSKSIQIYVGNHAPVISSSGATSYLVDVNNHETFKLFAYVSDAENDALTVTAVDDANISHTLTRVYTYGSKYVSSAITLATASDHNNFKIVANDGEDNSTASYVDVKTIASNQVPTFTKQLADATVNVNTSKTFACEAIDPEGTFITYSWKVGGVDVSETGTTFSQTFSTTGSTSVSCTATDADDKEATTTATILVVDPSVSGTLVIHTGYKDLKVSTHNTATFAVIETKTTDANGDASFSVVGDRTTFSVISWSGMEIGPNLLMHITKASDEAQARNNCYGNTTVTECTTADWCTLGETPTIANWIWDLATEEGEDKPAASAVDTNSDGFINASELYVAALAALDTNNDNKLSFAELEITGKNVNAAVYANIPVGEYNIDFSPIYSYYGHDYEECGETSFDVNITLKLDNDPDTKYNAYVNGSGYGYIYNQTVDDNNELKVHTNIYNQDSNDKYSLLAKVQETGNLIFYYGIINSKTKAELEAGITLNDTSDLHKADKNVTMTKIEGESFYIIPRLNGQYVNSYDAGSSTATTNSYMYYTNPAFTYSITGSKYDSATQVSKSHSAYYGITTLASNYNSTDYPYLDVTPVVAKDGSWTLSGSDMGKLNMVDYNFAVDAGSEGNLHVAVHWTVAPTQMPVANLLNMVPTDVKPDVISIISIEDAYTSSGISATEIKGLTEDALINATQNNSAYTLYRNGIRTVSYGSTQGSEPYSSLSTQSSTNSVRSTPMFTIGYDVSKIFSK